MINHMYDVETDCSSLNFQHKKLRIGTLDKVRLMTNICPNKIMKRFIKKGIKRFERDLDMMDIFKQHKHHHKHLIGKDEYLIKDDPLNID